VEADFEEIMNQSLLPQNILKAMRPEDRLPLGKKGALLEELVAKEQAHMEKTLHNLISQYLNLKGIFFIHSQFGKKTRSTPGVPDFVFSIAGHACAIEAKTENGELSRAQEEAITKMRCNGWSVEVCTSIQQAIGFINQPINL
jgi:hypothetical protein